MNKKLIIQLILIFVIFIIIFFTFYIYFFDKKQDFNSSNKFYQTEDISISEDQSNLIKDLEYETKDRSGNQYIIKSKLGEIDIANPDIIFMTDVIANIYPINTEPVRITSKYALYNSKNYKTNFYENVLVVYLNNKIVAEKMDLDFEKNIGTLTENIIYTSLNLELLADKVKIDLITKDTEIFMFKEKEKVKVFGYDKN